MAFSRAPISGGQTTETWYGNRKARELFEPVTIAASDTAVTLSQKIPANSRVLWSEMLFNTAIGLATATRVGLGTSADPDLLLLSGTTLTANTHTTPTADFGDTLLYASQAASTAVTATGPTTFDTKYSMPANTLKPGDVVRVRYRGTATTTTGAETVAITTVFGGGTVAMTAATDATNGDIFFGEMYFTVRSIGATGTFVGMGYGSTLAAAGTAAAVQVIKASTSFDSTAAFDIGVAVTNSGTGESILLDQITIELMRTASPLLTSETTLRVSCLSNFGVAAGTFNAAATAWVRVIYETFPAMAES